MVNVFPFRVDEGGHRGEDGVDDVIDGEEEDVEDGLPKRQQEVLPFPDDDDEIDEEARDIGPGKQGDDIVPKSPPIEITGIPNREE